MSEETQVLSIQDRIRALKQAQAGQSGDATGSPFLGSQPTAFALRPAPPRTSSINSTKNNNVPSVSPRPSVDHSTVPPGLPQRPIPQPPSRDRTPATEQKPKLPPPLPTRKVSDQQVPSLPRRRLSGDSVASDISRSTSTSVGKTASLNSSTSSGVRAPAWGDAELPPLPPKRQQTTPIIPSSRPKPTPFKSTGSLSVSRPTLPPRQSSNQSTSTDSGRFRSRPPPQLPSRDNRDRSPSAREEIHNQPPPKRLPPPFPSGATLGKIQQSGFSSINNKNVESGSNGVVQEKEVISNGLSSGPPPVPTASRPDLSKIQATKPRLAASTTNPTPAPSSGCLKCRDFSGPDTHATRYPRESLPTQDLGWLAKELTAPFISATDKARVIFTWLHHNINYDVVAFYNNAVKPSTPTSTLSSGLAVCEGYAGLFAALATRAGLEAVVVGGHGKGLGYDSPTPGAPLPPVSEGHAWNAVKIDNGQWKLIDPCWGAGAVQGHGQPYWRRFEPAMFTQSNDEFGLKHFPRDRKYFYRDDGRPEITWEEYIRGNPNSPLGAEMPRTYCDAQKHSIGELSFRPASKRISIYGPGPLRFQFNLICEHWSLEKHSRKKAALFMLIIKGVDGGATEYLPFTYFRGTRPDGGGDVWYLDIQDARILGAPGQKIQLVVLTKFGDRELEDCLGITAEEYTQQRAGKAMAFGFVAEWELVN